MHTPHDKIVRPDAKGRIFLGKLAEGVSSYKAHVDKDHRIILEPFVEVPLKEKWLYDSHKAHKSVKKGIKDSKAGQVHDLGRFSSSRHKEK